MNSYEKVHEILKKAEPAMAFGSKVSLEEALEQVYCVIREEYEHGISDGYEKGYKDGVKAYEGQDPGFMPPM